MSNDFRPALKIAEIAPGGMKAVEVEGHELVVCNCDGLFYVVARRCGHMNAPLELGTLDGSILTCPMHCAQFDVTTGEAVAGPVPADFGDEKPPARLGAYLQNIAMLIHPVRTESICTYLTKVDADQVWVALPERASPSK
jgi:nitrite reductase/ring-hydroxylating ferredoxin subunit